MVYFPLPLLRPGPVKPGASMPPSAMAAKSPATAASLHGRRMPRAGEWLENCMERKQNQDVTTAIQLRVHCGGIAAA
jgi:hypothetical protein